jgi:transposase
VAHFHHGPHHNVSLEDLVPRDSFYRYVQAKVDLHFVRDLVKEKYSAFGRPSIDPVVFFKLQLVMFFEGLRSERQLVQVAADRLSVRWYLGYDLQEPLPDHSSMTRIRDRYGLAIFRRFFDRVVEQCRQARLVWGKELYFDGTQVEANADRDKMLPRFYVDAVNAHLAELFGAGNAPSSEDSVPTPEPDSLPLPLPVEIVFQPGTQFKLVFIVGRVRLIRQAQRRMTETADTGQNERGLKISCCGKCLKLVTQVLMWTQP